MINNILDAQKLNSGKLELHTELVEYRKLVWKIIQAFKNTALKKGVHLEMFNDPKIPKYFELDITRLAQVITNFLGNAIKFTEQGEVSLKSLWIADLDKKQ